MTKNDDVLTVSRRTLAFVYHDYIEDPLSVMEKSGEVDSDELDEVRLAFDVIADLGLISWPDRNECQRRISALKI